MLEAQPLEQRYFAVREAGDAVLVGVRELLP
jgi:hypothetical protein